MTGNSIGIDVDRSSRSNTFFLNSFNNTVDVISQSARYCLVLVPAGLPVPGPGFLRPVRELLGRSPVRPTTTAMESGMRHFASHRPARIVPACRGDNRSGTAGQSSWSYTLTKSALAVNASPLGGLEPPAGFQSSLQPDNVQAQITSGSSQSRSPGDPVGTKSSGPASKPGRSFPYPVLVADPDRPFDLCGRWDLV